jgi:nascent polypeptide-associated complex subunit alpha
MMPGLDPRMMKQAMKRMGISQEEIDAQAVIIVLEDKRLVFEAPSLQRVTMQGEESFQLSGAYREEPLESLVAIDPADVSAVVEQTGASEHDAREALERSGGDIAAAIINLSE